MKKQKLRIKRGQTIVAEREQVESDSERLQVRKHLRRRRTFSVIIVVLLIAVLGLWGYKNLRGVVEEVRYPNDADVSEAKISAEVVDETGRERISERMRQYIIQVEQDFRDLGYRVTRVVLPINTSREIYVDLADQKPYFKINMDRDAAVSVEDAVRMLNYLEKNQLEPTYVDVRLEGKAYYK